MIEPLASRRSSPTWASTRATEDTTKIWAWTTATLGLVITGLTYAEGALLGTWADDHETVSQTMPGSEVEFVVAALGLVLLVGGVIVGIRTTKKTDVR